MIRDLNGKRFGRLEVLEFAGSIQYRSGKKRTRKCKCDCGKEKVILGGNLLKGVSTSCGCYHLEKFLKDRTNPKPIHGMCYTKFYGIYHNIKMRCNNKNYTRYKDRGGRGIKCLRKNFAEFRDDMYQSYLEHRQNNKYTTIDRIDNDLNYCKDNCKRATQKEQRANQRTPKIRKDSRL